MTLSISTSGLVASINGGDAFSVNDNGVSINNKSIVVKITTKKSNRFRDIKYIRR